MKLVRKATLSPFKLKPLYHSNVVKRSFSSTPADSTPVDESRYNLPDVEKAKAIMNSRISGTFTSVPIEGKTQVPLYGSILPYILHDDWYSRPVFAVNKQDFHHKNITSGNAKCSLLIIPLTPKRTNPSKLPLPKVNMLGKAKQIESEGEIEAIIEKFAKTLPGIEELLKKDDFAYYVMNPTDIHYVTSSGSLNTFTADEFIKAKEDPIAKNSRKILETFNEKYKNEIEKICYTYGQIKVHDAFIIGLDKLGFDMIGLRDDSIWQPFRMPWPSPIIDLKNYEITLKNALKEVK